MGPKTGYKPSPQWQVVRRSTGEPLFPEPVRDRDAALLMAKGYLRMDMLRDPKTDEVHYTTRTDAQVTALLTRDYRLVQYELREISGRH